jgi:PASTA domain-containing protein
MAWLGRKKLAFIPLSRTNIQPPDVIPSDWPGQIMQRVFFDPPTNSTGTAIPGTDRSVRAYFHTVSSGLADLDVVVLPPKTIGQKDVPPDALEATLGNELRSKGFDGAAIVMLGGPGGGSTSQLSNFAWSRFCMSDNLGNWVGEILHQTNLCDLPDLFDFAGQYPSGDNMGPFDQEAGYRATHPCAWTKRAVGWLDPSSVVLHLGQAADYTLHAISLIQPPPTGRKAAVQIGAQVPYLMVEARLKADQFDVNIPNEGVIVYRVQTTDPLGNAQNNTAPLALLTKNALTEGQSFTTDGVTIKVGSAVPGGFSIHVSTSNPLGIVPDVFELTANIAAKVITNAGFVPKFSRPNASGLWVSSQSPLAGATAPLGSTVTMTMHSGPRP